ncbi:MAG: hypothetical protein V4564_09795 [Pseudomonadota bacterium]|nr:hypothetical protein [Sphingomonas sp. ERG5]
MSGLQGGQIRRCLGLQKIPRHDIICLTAFLEHCASPAARCGISSARKIDAIFTELVRERRSDIEQSACRHRYPDHQGKDDSGTLELRQIISRIPVDPPDGRKPEEATTIPGRCGRVAGWGLDGRRRNVDWFMCDWLVCLPTLMIGEPTRRIETRGGAQGGNRALDPLVDRVRGDIEDLRNLLGVATRQDKTEACPLRFG